MSDLPHAVSLPLAAAIRGLSREAGYDWAARNPRLVTRAPGRPACVAVAVLEQLLGRPVTPEDLARGLARLEQRRIPATPTGRDRVGASAA